MAASVSEAILEPDLPIIDPHHHLWDRAAGALPNLAASGHGFLEIIRDIPRYLLDELFNDVSSGHNILGTVYMECRQMYRADGPEAFKCVGETEFVNGMAAISASGRYGALRACAGIVGHVNLCAGAAAEDVLRAHFVAAPARFRGIRHVGAHDNDPEVLGPLSVAAPPGLYFDTKFRQGFRVLAGFGASFDAWVLEPQLPELIDLARTFPETTIVLDHIGTPLGLASYQDKRQERFGIWSKNIKLLAECENVFVKIGGLAQPFLGWRKAMAEPLPQSERLALEWKPYVETCIEAFGAGRCMFESNFPVDRFGCDYAALWNAFKRIATNYSDFEKTALFSGTAKKLYRLEFGGWAC